MATLNTSDTNKCHYLEDEDLWITCKGRLTFVALARKFKSKKSTRPNDEGQYAIGLAIPPPREHQAAAQGRRRSGRCEVEGLRSLFRTEGEEQGRAQSDRRRGGSARIRLH